MEYTGGLPTAVIDALSNRSEMIYDSAGRVSSAKDALGNISRIEYDALNRTTKVTDAMGAATEFTYDNMGNRLTLKDARLNVTTWTYDAMNRAATMKDPLVGTPQATYGFDKNGNLTSTKDRKNQVTGVTYDPLNRPKVMTFADASTITLTYDGAGGRVSSIVDSLNGTITRTYDAFDRVLTETTPQGTITYTYDAIGRRATMQVTGQTQVVYGYDNANRPTTITQGTSVVSFGYDSAGRRSTVTLPNGVVATFGYDGGSRLTSMTWAKAGVSLGNLTYGYDALGRRTSMGGSLARVGLPAALSSATFDGANRMTARGAATLTYDNNGNLTNDGSQSYTWNARDQLSAVGTASFAYDAGGRRRSRTVAGGTTTFLYDGANPIQEQVGGSPVANTLGGMAMDEVYQRTDAGGARSFQTDGLNSTLGLMDAAGSTTAAYSYEPFGASTVAGGSGNSFTFTGRESDGTGLMYYRARYYSPGMQRFISQDPLGFGGGDVNLYAYVGNGPTNGTDPTGMMLGLMFGGALMGALINGGVSFLWQSLRQARGGEPVNYVDVWGAAWAGFLGGAASAFLGVMIADVGMIMLVGGVIGAIGNVLQVLMSAPRGRTGPEVLAAVVLALGFGFVGGALGAALGGLYSGLGGGLSAWLWSNVVLAFLSSFLIGNLDIEALRLLRCQN